MPNTTQGIKLTPMGGYTYAVTITRQGATVVAYTSRDGSSAHTFPVNVGPTDEVQFWTTDPGTFVISAKVNGIEVAGRNGQTLTVSLERGNVYVGALSVDPEEAGSGVVSSSATSGAGLGVGGIDVTAHGAVADSNGTTGNGTDNTAAFVAAIAAAAAAGTRICAPPNAGSYFRVTAQLVIAHDNGGIVGPGRIFADFTTDYPAILVSKGAYPAGGVGVVDPVSALKDAVLRDFEIKGRKTNGGGNGSLIDVWGVQGAVVDGVHARDSNGMGIVVFGRGVFSSDVSVTNNHVHDTVFDGIHCAGADRVSINNNHVHDTADDCIGVGYEEYVKNVTINGNAVERTGARGIAVMGATSAGGVYVERVSVTGNAVSDTFLAGIRVEYSQGNAVGISIGDNTIQRAGGFSPPAGMNARGGGVAAGVLVAGGAASAYGAYFIGITGNTIFDVENSFIAVGVVDIGGAGGSINDVHIADNTCVSVAHTGGKGNAAGTGGGVSAAPSPAAYPAILVRNATHVKVSGNLLHNFWQEAVAVESSCSGIITVSDNTCEQPNTVGGARYAYKIASGSVNVAGNVAQLGGFTLTGIVDVSGATVIQNVNNPAPVA